MQDRIERIEKVVAELEARVARLEAAVTAGAERAASALQRERPAAASTTLAEPVLGEGRGLQLGEAAAFTGRSCLILGGAFLLRALTQGGTFSPRTGMILGLVYGLLWLVMATRSGLAERRLSAAFYGVTAVLIAYPLIWETTTRFGSLTPGMAAALLALVTTGAVVVGVRFHLRFTANAAAVAALVTAFALLVATHSAEVFVAVLLLTGLETAGLAYAVHWHAIRWPAAFVVDVAILQLANLAAAPGGPPEQYRGLSPSLAIVLTLALFIGYVTLSASRAAFRSRDLNWFEVLQSAAAFIVGFSGAVRICRAGGGSCAWLAWLALGLAAAAYVVAYAYVDRLKGQNRAFYLFLAEGLILFVTGTWLLVPAVPRAVIWAVAAFVAVAAAARLKSGSLAAQAAIIIALAGFAGGCFWHFGRTLLAEPHAPSVLVICLALATTALYLLVDRFRPERPGFAPRWPQALAAGLAAGELWAVAVSGTAVLLHTVSPGALAAVRTVLGSLAALGLTALGARLPARKELAVLGTVALGAVGLKLVLQDLPAGDPSAAVVSLVTFGLALLLAGRFRRRADAGS